MQLASQHLPVEYRRAVDRLASDIIDQASTTLEDGTEVSVKVDEVLIAYVISGPTILHGGCKLLDD